MLRMYQKIDNKLARVGYNIGRRLYQKRNDALVPIQSLWRKMEDGSLKEIKMTKSETGV